MKIRALFCKHPDELFTSDEVCTLLRVSQRTLYRMIKKGKLPCTKVGSTYRFRVGKIRTYYETMPQDQPLYCKPEVLQKYLTQSDKYKVRSLSGGGGWIEIIKISEAVPAGDAGGGLIRFHERRLPHGEKVTMLTPHQLGKLPENEKIHWRRFEIT